MRLYVETVEYLRICEGEGALRWGRMYAGVEAEVWWREGASTLTWGRMYAKARVKVRCGEGGGIVRSERGGIVAVAGEGRWRAECS